MEYELKEKLCPYPFCGEESNVYGQIQIVEEKWDGENGVTISVNVSLLNHKMISEELNAVESDKAPLYFYEFTGEHTFEVPNEFIEYRYRYEYEYEYYYHYLRRYEGLRRIKIISVEQFNENIYELDNLIYFEGEILFSASPIITNKGIIVIDEGPIPNTDWEKIVKIFNGWDDVRKKKCITDKTQINKELNGLFSKKVSSASIDIYNVAQANCICCTINGKKIMCDIGITRNTEDRESSKVQKVLSEVSKLDVQAVFLSHWDLDHILGVCYNQSCLTNKIWIVPDFEKLYSSVPLSIKRLCNYLLKVGKSKICLIDTEDLVKEYFESNDKKISIYLGTPRASFGIKKTNNGGLLLKIMNNKSILLPGDCENSIIPSSATKDELDYIVVPHHGSNMSNPNVKGKSGKTNIAYICRGKHPGHCNYDVDINEKYRRKNFTIVRNTLYLKKTKYSISL